jgi:hypothetical protein
VEPFESLSFNSFDSINLWKIDYTIIDKTQVPDALENGYKNVVNSHIEFRYRIKKLAFVFHRKKH